jgi:hypothetical protein
MAYISGDLILDDHYNTFATGGADGTANIAVPNINSIWGVGNGNIGYGQSTTLSNVTVGTSVTSTQWSTMISRLNSILTHQLGSGSGITAPVTGDTITILNNLSTRLASARANVALFTTQGTTVTGSNDATNPSAGATSAFSYFRDCNVTFASANAARYFFNGGGQINFVCSAVDNAGTTRSATLRDMINQVGGLTAFRQNTNGGRSGAGGTIITNDTTKGYRQLILNTPITLVDNNVAGIYSAHNVVLQVFTDSSDTTNGANGTKVIFRLVMTAPADDAFGGSINITLTMRADIVHPETTNLTNTWGTPTISYEST